MVDPITAGLIIGGAARIGGALFDQTDEESIPAITPEQQEAQRIFLRIVRGYDFENPPRIPESRIASAFRPSRETQQGATVMRQAPDTLASIGNYMGQYASRLGMSPLPSSQLPSRLGTMGSRIPAVPSSGYPTTITREPSLPMAPASTPSIAPVSGRILQPPGSVPTVIPPPSGVIPSLEDTPQNIQEAVEGVSGWIRAMGFENPEQEALRVLVSWAGAYGLTGLSAWSSGDIIDLIQGIISNESLAHLGGGGGGSGGGSD